MAKSKWDDVKNKLILVEGWCRNGLTEAQIANNLGISIQTFYTYKKDHIEFLEALKRNKEVADLEVENALFKRALGYSYEEIEETYEGKTLVEKKVKKKKMAPDVTAQIIWLKNRKPQDWRDKRDIAIEQEEDKKIVIEHSIPRGEADADKT